MRVEKWSVVPKNQIPIRPRLKSIDFSKLDDIGSYYVYLG
jgi:hypothetical protein